MSRGPDGSLWVGTDNGLARGTPGGWVVIPGLEGYSLKAVVVDREGSVWASGNPIGLHHYEPRSGRLRTLGVAEGYPAHFTFALVVEPDGTLWSAGSSGLLRGVRKGAEWTFEPVLPPSSRMAFMSVMPGRGRAAVGRG